MARNAKYLTLISRELFGYALVVLATEGPRRYHGQIVYHDQGKGGTCVNPCVLFWEKQEFVPIPGIRFDIVKRFDEVRRQFDQSTQAWSRRREQAVRDFRARWEQENRYPTLPTVQTVVEECNLVLLPSGGGESA